MPSILRVNGSEKNHFLKTDRVFCPRRQADVTPFLKSLRETFGAVAATNPRVSAILELTLEPEGRHFSWVPAAKRGIQVAIIIDSVYRETRERKGKPYLAGMAPVRVKLPMSIASIPETSEGLAHVERKIRAAIADTLELVRDREDAILARQAEENEEWEGYRKGQYESITALMGRISPADPLQTPGKP